MDTVVRKVNIGLSADAREGGLCTEIGPGSFRCDWGSVNKYVEGQTIGLKWQIGPNREPIPDPEKASNLTVDFHRKGDDRVAIELRHYDFQNHGEQGPAYCKSMGSVQGWKYILGR